MKNDIREKGNENPIDELRALPAVELRVADNDDGPVIEGYAVMWNSLSEDLGGFRERFQRGAFADTLANDDIRVQWQHDKRFVFGRVKAGTAQVWEDGKGLAFRATPPNAQWAKDAIESIRRGDIDQNSFAFFVEDKQNDQRFERSNGSVVRTVLKARLIHVGPETEPAYTDTTVALRSLEEARLEPEDDAPVPEGVPAEDLARKLRLALSDA